MSISIEQLADELTEAYAKGAWGQVVASHLAERVDIRHFPEETSDGPKDAKELAEALTHDQSDKLAYLLTDFSRTAESVVVEENTIVAKIVISGSLPGRSPINAPITTVYTVDKGKIIQIDNHADDPGAIELRNAAIAHLGVATENN